MASTSSSCTFNTIRAVAGSIMVMSMQCENEHAKNSTKSTGRRGRDESEGGVAREERTVDRAKTMRRYQEGTSLHPHLHRFEHDKQAVRVNL